MIFILSVLLSLFGASEDQTLTATHDIHISRTEIDYNTDTRRFEIALHIFIDDLELALEDRGWTDLFICTDRETKDSDIYIKNYLDEKLMIGEAKDTIKFEWIGKEVSEDLQAVWCYIESEEVDIIESLNLSNGIFMDMYPDQKNITTLTFGDLKKHFLFDAGKFSVDIAVQ